MNDAKQALAEIIKKPSGPIRKFALIKLFGGALTQAGYSPKEMDCAALEAAIAKLLPRLKRSR